MIFEKIFWTIILAVVTLGYIPLNRRKPKYYWNLPIDEKIPLIKWMIFPYVFYFILEILTLLVLFNSSLYLKYTKTYILIKSLALVFWYLFPNGVKRKKITGGELRSKLINYIYDHDGETNAFPSGHVYGSLLMTYYLVEAGFGWWWYVIGIAVSLSTLFVKQHYIVDIFGGLLWVIVGIWLGTFF